MTARIESEERSAMADDLRRGKDLAERASEAKTQLLSRVSHELRTPLNAISAFAQTMELDETTPLPVARNRRIDDLPPAHYGPRCVLCIEDNPINARVLARMLKARPQIQLSIAFDGESGLRMAGEVQPHLVLIDLDLPDISGFDVLQRLRSDPQFAGVPCAAVTASVMPENVARGRAPGFADYIGKPLEMCGFIARVDVMLESEPLPERTG